MFSTLQITRPESNGLAALFYDEVADGLHTPQHESYDVLRCDVLKEVPFPEIVLLHGSGFCYGFKFQLV